MVGVITDVSKYVTQGFKDAGDVIVLLGETAAELGGSEYLKVIHGMAEGKPPALDLAVELALHETLVTAAERDLLKSAHDCSEGGLAIALAESCLSGDIGADVHLSEDLPPVASLFSESQSRAVVTVAQENVDELFDVALDFGTPFAVIGTVGGDALAIEGMAAACLDHLRGFYEPTLARLVHGTEELQTEELREG
jgi:phosphoribosylformylglycinamidine synthase